jgi:2-polyprenyl-3-methyl-5-hydroxy-6-metoxy-1,4-benzoquinol methylase
MNTFLHKHSNVAQPPLILECPICQRDSNQINSLFLLNLIDSATFHCTKCKTYFRQPLPEEEAVAQYYASRSFHHPDEIERTMAEIQGKWIVYALQQDDINLESIHYVEFGAGRGWLVSFMQNQNIASAVGYEPDSTSVQWGRNRFQINLREGFLAHALIRENFSANGVTVLALIHVLEHLRSPTEVLKTLRARYQDSYLFLEVPDADWEGSVMELDTFSQSSIGQHFWSFTEQSLRIILERTGFIVVKCMKDGKPGFWDTKIQTLKVWKTISEHYLDCYQNGFSVKKGAMTSIAIAGMCFMTGIRLLLQRLWKQNYNRLDLPVIRILAKAKP